MPPLHFFINRCPERGQLCPRESKLRDSRTWLSAPRFMNARCRFWFARCLVGCLAGVALRASAQPEVYGNPDSSAFIRIPKDTDDWTRHFHIGALVGMNINASFSMNGNFNVNRPAGVYDNGYVRTDNTGDPGGRTYYWGYDSPSQLSGTTLTMQNTTGFSAVSNVKEDGGPFPGFEMAYGDNLWYWKHARVGWELGFGLLPIHIANNQPTDATAYQTTYTFDVSNPLGAPVPGSGSGTPYQGGPNGPGYQIPDQPTSYSSSTNHETIGGSHTLDVMLYTFRFGPSFYWDLTDHLGMSLGAGPAVGIVSGEYKFDEIIGGGPPNTGQINGTKLVYGGYVNAALMYHVTDNGDIFAGAQYMPMSDATIGGGGREGRLNLGGQLYFSVGISWPF
ncbi:MAG TPA: hypothetical protein VN836_06800 [Verrucomicrobiae bacterium]|nr:hypothetical protein [Verrucomicrobiae bacterium]